MNYIINQKQLTCINILIRTLQEAINRECFDENEIQNILKTIKELNCNSKTSRLIKTNQKKDH